MSATPSSTTPKKRRIGKIIGIVCGSLFLLLLIGYFVLTSSAFFKGVILPRVGKAINADITVADVSFSPFSKIILTKLEVKPHGREPLLTADEVRLRYKLRDIIGGKITVDEVLIASPVITIVKTADGSSNLEPITQSDKNSAKNKSSKDENGKPLVLNIKNVSLKNALVRQTTLLKNGGREVTELSNLNLSMDQLKNGEAGKLTLSAAVKMETTPVLASTNSAPGSLQANLAGAFDYKLTKDALPESAKGNLRFEVSEAKGGMAELARLAATVNCDVTPTDLRDVSLRFEQAGQNLGELRASGPFSFANLEGKLKVELSSLDRRVLNLAGASSGMDFNSTTLSSTNEISVSQKGNSISISGQLLASQFSLTKKESKETTPILNLRAAYRLTADQKAQSATVQSLDLNGTQNGEKFLGAALSKPMPISWGGASSAPEDAALKVAITDLNLADWKSFAGEMAPSGKLNATLEVVSQQAGKQLSINLLSKLNNFSATFGSNQISNATIETRLKAGVVEMKKLSLQEYQIELSQNQQAALTLNGSGTVDLESKEMDLKTSLRGSFAPLLKVIVMPALAIKSGDLKFDGRITQSKETQSVIGNFSMTDVVGTNSPAPISAQIDLDATARNNVYDLKKLLVTLSPTTRAKNQLNVTGQMDFSKTNALKGKLLVQSESLDLTPFYDLYSPPVQNLPANSTSPSPALPPTATNPNQEPEAMHLPVEQFLAQINIGQFYLRDIEIKDWRGTAKVEGSHVTLKPFQLSLNGAPVKLNLDLNLGVKGYAYDLSATLDRVPLEPLANFFVPEKRGAYQGTIIASADIKGVGTTGASLKKNLTGQISLTLTNADIKIVGPKIEQIIVPIATVLLIPEIAQTPLNWIDAKLNFGDGKITVTKFTAESEAFRAGLQTVIPIADVLTNSPLDNVPVNFELRRSFAKKAPKEINLNNGAPSADGKYVMLPTFVRIRGTLGDPKAKTDLKSLLLQGVGAIGGDAGKVLQGLSGILNEKNTNAPSTNGVSTNQTDNNLIPNVINLFKKKKK
ncbi:MAG: AsmA family protein [Verrucomicrobiota bacterium]